MNFCLFFYCWKFLLKYYQEKIWTISIAVIYILNYFELNADISDMCQAGLKQEWILQRSLTL